MSAPGPSKNMLPCKKRSEITKIRGANKKKQMLEKGVELSPT